MGRPLAAHRHFRASPIPLATSSPWRTYRGGAGLPLQFFEDCDAGFTSYLGVAPDRSPVPAGELRSVPMIPSVAVWNDGDRHVVCTVRVDRLWSGSLRDHGDLTPPGLPATEVASAETPAC